MIADLAKLQGADIQTNQEIVSIVATGGGFEIRTRTHLIHARRVLCAAGAWTGAIAKMVGADIGVGGHVHSVSVTETIDPILPILVQHAAGGLTMKQTKVGTMLIGGGWGGVYDTETRKAWASREGISAAADLAQRILPSLAEVNVLRSWGGVIARTPNGQPVIGEVPDVPGFYIAVVPSGSAGFTVAPTVGRLFAEAIVEEREVSEFSGYAPARGGSRVGAAR
jgi:glycine/D-amino acid oxidase-like deaminating enzyme